MGKNPFVRSFGIILTALVLLAAYPWLHRAVPWLGVHFTTYNPLARLLSSPAPDPQSDPVVKEDSGKRGIAPHPQKGNTPEFVLPPEAFQSEHAQYDGSSYLQPFQRLLKDGGEQVRVAYFGDSSVEGDLIAQTLRESLQQRFGGAGVGFLPILPAVQNFRRTVHQTASGNWQRHKPGSKTSLTLPVGITGDFYTAAGKPLTNLYPDSLMADTLPAISPGGHWARFSAGKVFPGTQRFPTARFFYGRPGNKIERDSQILGRVELTIGDKRLKIGVSAPSPLNVLTLPVENATRLKLEFSLPDNLPVYGISMESPDGIIIDNFPMRGNSGTGLLNIPESQMAAFQQALDYDLILIQFGLNVLNAALKDFSWYEEQMIRTIVHLKKSMPGAGIVIIGLPDKSIKVDGVMRSDPSVARITAAQRRAAFRCGVPFFSIYEAMGGENSMVDWVERRRLANWDYTHFNFDGAEKISAYLLKFLLGEENALSSKI